MHTARTLVFGLASTLLAPCWLGHPPGAQTVRSLSDPLPAKLRVERVEELSQHTTATTLIGFGGLGSANPLGEIFSLHGIRFLLADDLQPTVWVDPTGRDGALNPLGGRQTLLTGPISAKGIEDFAIRGTQPYSGLFGAQTLQPSSVPAALPQEAALRILFQESQSRVSFHLRSLDPHELTAMLTILRGGNALATRTFSVATIFGLMGMESTVPFDELRIDFVNPGAGSFSLDNLRFEIDTHDFDGDGFADFADVCPGLFDPVQADADGDGLGDLCDPFPADAGNDEDGDGFSALIDNCPQLYNPAQLDADGDGIGDACDPLPNAVDTDGDGIPDVDDNCPMVFNPVQVDCDDDGIGDLCDANRVMPGSLDLTLARGETAVISSAVCMPPVPEQIDILIAIDLTGSMLAEIANLKSGLVDFVERTREKAAGDLEYGLVSYEDYPGSFSSCGYSNVYGASGDSPFRVDASFGVGDDEIIAGVNGLVNGSGADGPESYTRVLWEAWQPDSGIGWRFGSKRIVVLVNDNVPHDCLPNEGLGACPSLPSTTGVDPGRDATALTADDIDFHDNALEPLIDNETEVVTLFSGGSFERCAWGVWSDSTGGEVLQINSNGSIPAGVNVVNTILVHMGLGHVARNDFVVSAPCGLNITLDPPFIDHPVDIGIGRVINVEESITVPIDLDPAITEIDCSIEFFADGVLIATQPIHVIVE